jgi:hypothetical protein
MKHRIIYFCIAILLVMLATTLGAYGSPTSVNLPEGDSRDELKVTTEINGLEAGDKAIIDISRAGEMLHENAIFSTTVVGDGKTFYVELPSDFTDGAYQVTIDATNKYYRQPQGYFFTVRDSQIYNPQNFAIKFELIPPSARAYEPSRNSFYLTPVTKVVPPTNESEETRPLRAEPFRDLSAPKKEPIPDLGENGTRGTKYYTNFGTSAANHGVYGVLTPVDNLTYFIRWGFHSWACIFKIR